MGGHNDSESHRTEFANLGTIIEKTPSIGTLTLSEQMLISLFASNR